jgi:hypothetical protein
MHHAPKRKNTGKETWGEKTHFTPKEGKKKYYGKPKNRDR